MRHIAAVIAVGIVAVSWVAATAASLGAEYLGWRAVIVDHDIANGLLLAVVVAPIAFMLIQTVIGLCALPFGWFAERGESDVYGVDDIGF